MLFMDSTCDSEFQEFTVSLLKNHNKAESEADITTDG
jgi:hypothetical protein